MFVYNNTATDFQWLIGALQKRHLDLKTLRSGSIGLAAAPLLIGYYIFLTEPCNERTSCSTAKQGGTMLYRSSAASGYFRRLGKRGAGSYFRLSTDAQP